MQFRTKARAVDLLGKGQIADLPTAITELWKNGYDAYADNLTAEIYLKGYRGLEKPMFVMTDDGVGMSQNDILDKWLVLGTDSKTRAKIEKAEVIDTLWKKPRIKSGEKGIGRLSVAFLGSPMLMLSKKQGYPLQALFFDWRLLENYNLFLDDIHIPVKDIKSESDFEIKFKDLKSTFLKNFDKEADLDGNSIWEADQENLKKEIQHSIDNINTPYFFIKEIISDLLNIEESHGTKFIIFEPIDQIHELIINDEDYILEKEFIISSLSGFTNEFIENHNKVNTLITVNKELGNDYDFLNSKGNFFNSDDYSLADVIIEGNFDGKGSFNGKLTIYNETIEYSYTNPRKKDTRNDYGYLPIKLGYSQGRNSESKLDSISWQKINDKVTTHGALYIYRDNFRVLPYGRTDFDFLGFEKRRANRAGSAYFSHRRMFGFIGLTREFNPKLKDKSSREGLINNAQYRAFKYDLEAFFKELAREYFGTEAKQSIFLDKKEALKKRFEVIGKDKVRETQEKRDFSRSLNTSLKRFEEYQTEHKRLLAELDKKTKSSDVLYSDIESLLEKINNLDIEYKKILPKIPKRYTPTDLQLDRLDKYETLLITFNETIKIESADLMLRVQEKLEIQALKKEFEKGFIKYNATLENQISDNRQVFKDKFEYLFKEFNQRSKSFIGELKLDKNKLSAGINSKEDAIVALDKIKTKYEFLSIQIENDLLPIVEHIKRIDFDIDEEFLQGAYKAEYDVIKHQWEQTRETAQLGIAVEIIDHEFNHLYAAINSSLNKLNTQDYFSESKQFAYLNKNFKQLEEKYDLLSPLYRISGVISKEIKCASIHEYLSKFFSSKIKNGEVNFIATEAFIGHTINVKEPVIHTVFINIMNNALYWIRNAKNKTIKLDYWPDTNEILIINSGQKIEEHKISKIFDLFYSNRPNGRGIGLYLAKESLNENYLNIYATNEKIYNKFNGACFVINKLN